MIKFTLHFIYNYFRYRKRIEFYYFLQYYKAKYCKREKLYRMQIKNCKNPFFIRGGTSDIDIFRDFFLEQQYAVTNNDAKSFIDAGANIGAATFLFKTRNPEAVVIAIEPEESNCKMFNMNCQVFDNVTLLKRVLYHSSDIGMNLRNEAAFKFSYRYDLSELDINNEVLSISINDIVNQYNLIRIDVLKIDIEGGEKSVFEKNTEWIDAVDQIIIEIHDHYVPNSSSTLIKAISPYNFKISWAGENLVLNKEILQM